MTFYCETLFWNSILESIMQGTPSLYKFVTKFGTYVSTSVVADVVASFELTFRDFYRKSSIDRCINSGQILAKIVTKNLKV